MHKFITHLVNGSLMLGFFPFSSIPMLMNNPVIAPVEQGYTLPAIDQNLDYSLTRTFFGSEVTNDSVDSIVSEKMAFVSSRNAYPASLAVIKKHANVIRQIAQEKGVPEDVAIGVALLENGGSETAVSKAGALGVFQLMPGTARALGLAVTKKVDERRDPNLNIEAGITYLRQNYERFGDWGLATWAYHAGEGNVAKALKLYAKEKDGINLPGVKEASTLRAYVEKNGLTVHKLLSSKAVQTLTKKLNDDSAGYPYKVLATAKLFREAKTQTITNPGVITRSNL